MRPIPKTINQQEILEIFNDILNWNRYTALRKIKSIENSDLIKKLELNEILVLYYCELGISYQLGWVENAYKIIKKIIKTYIGYPGTKNEISNFLFQIISLWENIWNKNLEEASTKINLIEKEHNILLNRSRKNSDSEIEIIIWDVYWIILVFYLESGEWKKSAEFIKKRLEWALENKNHYLIFWAYDMYLSIYPKIAEYLDPIQFSKDRLAYFESINEKNYILRSLQKLASDNYNIGYLKDALNYCEKANKYVNMLTSTNEGQLSSKLNFYNMYGIILSCMGRNKEAITIYSEAQKYATIVFNMFPESMELSMISGNMAEAYEELGNNLKALKYFEQSFELVGNSISSTSRTEKLYQLVKVNILLERFEDATKLFNLFEEEIQKWSNFHILFENMNAQFEILKSLFLLRERSIQAMLDAQKSLQKVVNNENIKNELLIDALIPLIELTIQEYKNYQNPETFKKIEEQLEKFSEFVKNYNSIPLKLESLILKSKLELVNGNFEYFHLFINEALNLATEYQLENYKILIESEILKVNKEAEKWKKLNPIKSLTAIPIEIKDYLREIYSLNDLKDQLNVHKEM